MMVMVVIVMVVMVMVVVVVMMMIVVMVIVSHYKRLVFSRISGSSLVISAQNLFGIRDWVQQFCK